MTAVYFLPLYLTFLLMHHIILSIQFFVDFFLFIISYLGRQTKSSSFERNRFKAMSFTIIWLLASTVIHHTVFSANQSVSFSVYSPSLHASLDPQLVVKCWPQ